MKRLMVLCFLFVSSLANAAVVWTANPMACVPAGAPILWDNHDSSAGKVRFKEGKVGKVILICPISSMLTEFSLRSIRMTYQDADGKQGPALITAEVRKVRVSDGHVQTLTNGTVSSNDSNAPNSGPNGWATHQSGTAGNVMSERLDLSKFYYYVQITMTRRGEVPLSVLGVHIIS